MLLAVNGLLVRQTREALGLTREECCKEAGISLSTLKKIERGCNARPKTMRAIASVLGVDPRLLAGPFRPLGAGKGEAGLISLAG